MKHSRSFAGLLLVIALASCTKKAPDQAFCDCLTKETTAYLAAHPGFTVAEASEAEAAIGKPCMAEMQSSYSADDFSKLSSDERQRLNKSMEACAAEVATKLEAATK